MPSRILLEDVVEEHAEEAAFLWHQRDAAVRAPDYDISEIETLDERVEAHLDGLRIAGDQGWEIVEELGWSDAGGFFTAMSMAIHDGNMDRLAVLLEDAADDAEAVRGLVSALGWAAPSELQGWVKALLTHPEPVARQVGIGACAVHRVNPGRALEQALNDRHPGLLARALKTCGELGLADWREAVEKQLDHEDDECRFWASWSGGLLGSARALKVLGLFAAHDNPRRRQAINLLLRRLPAEDAKQWLRSQAGQGDQLRWALIGSGVQGDPAFLEPLIRQFSNEGVARVAGEAFEMITGLNIFRESLEVLPDPDHYPPPPSDDDADDEDDDEELGEDLGLVVPDAAKIQPWFEARRDSFPSGERFLCGAPISPEHCHDILRKGQQRQRQAAALELALVNPGQPLFETRAPGHRQRAQFGRRA